MNNLEKNNYIKILIATDFIKDISSLLSDLLEIKWKGVRRHVT